MTVTPALTTGPGLTAPRPQPAVSQREGPEEPRESVDIAHQITRLGSPGKTGEKSGLDLAGRLSGPVGLTAAMWASEIVDTALGNRLDGLGILPRTPQGLLGVGTAPFLHGGFSHLANNSLGMLVAGGMIAAQSPKKFRDVSLISAVASGLGYWLTAPPGAVGIGASGMVYGYIGYNMARGIFERKPLPIAMTVASLVLFAGSLPGLLPGQPGVGWQAHLFGFAAGVAAAALLPRDGK
ncbi:rhomboid family intramembrane serine protease [bacterium CPR1]|nr:rhomboid family intramembrane serine protease [bacterium CPR1]